MKTTKTKGKKPRIVEVQEERYVDLSEEDFYKKKPAKKVKKVKTEEKIQPVPRREKRLVNKIPGDNGEMVMFDQDVINLSTEDDGSVRLSEADFNAIKEQLNNSQIQKKKSNSIFSGVMGKIIVILIILLAMMFAVRFLFMGKFFNSYSSTAFITEQKLEACQELVTLKYKYKDVVVITPENPLVKSFSIVQFQGIIRVGIRDITESDIIVSDNGKSVKVTLPFIEVLGNDISEQELLKEMKSFLGSVSNKAVIDKINEQRQRNLEEMIDDGIYEEAQKNAEAVVRNLLLSMGYENENIEITCQIEPFLKDLPDLTPSDLEAAASGDLTMGE
ncbi:MAG: DUF4230 domain-containing protein [Treponema sp.]|nr:DUF4230 domain-containing protein [Treponema sp.]